ncbi:TolC family outer membrane protein [Pseudomonas matsuisoli]|uniref:Agglutination protein n=1 Tax=Pseudomonas matsuisoli TaxID=1515666 RepID=A0A917PZB4_9PSED|nr:TolC family outer membrane protein [Pseudomonas matsuisoli]GGK02874.1 agglutination protein [Pseudomonas matsuisoli]
MRLRLASAIALALSVGYVQAQTLQQAMQQTIDSHPELQGSINSRLSADQDLRAARAGYLPSVDLSAGYGREGTNNNSTRAGEESWRDMNRTEARIGLSQMIYDGGATKGEVGRQAATVNSRAFRVLGTAERIALRTAEVYIDVLRREELVRLAQENLTNHERILDQIRLRTERGVGRTADYDQAEARTAQARSNLLTEQTNLSDARINYLSAVGNAPQDLSIPDGLAGRMPQDLDDARRTIIENNPVLKSAESDIAATEKQYEAARSLFLPRFDAEISRSADDNIDGVSGRNEEWQAMVRMRYNLFAGGGSSAQRESRAYQIQEALDIRNNALRQLNEEIGLAWNALETARQQLPVAQQYAERAGKVRTAYQAQFSLGDRTLLDLLDSENETFTAQRNLADIRFTELFSQYRIMAATGELLRSQSVAAPMAGVSLNDVKSQVHLPGLD